MKSTTFVVKNMKMLRMMPNEASIALGKCVWDDFIIYKTIAGRSKSPGYFA
ncbi:hypothetical protein GGR07_001088 [Bacteroides pyogenes]|nr:hypothetical protein [Bacteroides pyogenes]SUV35206.1 Uncharacterised protein [Bacteroides pyogenes]